MNENLVMVESTCDSTVVIDLPLLPLRRTWTKIGAKYPIDRNLLEQAFYDASVEALFREGILYTEDKLFMQDVGLMDSDGTIEVVHVTDNYFNRMIKLMPLVEFKSEFAKLSNTQRNDLADYAIEHYENLNLDRIDIISKATGRNLLQAIQNMKADAE